MTEKQKNFYIAPWVEVDWLEMEDEIAKWMQLKEQDGWRGMPPQ
ncbi:hypothetical protein [Sphingobacterium sp. CZ-UAM]|nr:hypothetical protein [Sphingobacterium sp. CZ-UAM]